ncbi:ATPase, T2SS/T4P/T4SS family [Acetobacter sp. LMG 32666]|uniref:ATPase, T2SS/T4P/T4SS family n=1 Tax=Acetobacter sp. LMG 32666 TaxID=2959295 RepID=UPI0030C7A769
MGNIWSRLFGTPAQGAADKMTASQNQIVIDIPRSLEGQIFIEANGDDRTVFASRQLQDRLHFLQWLDTLRYVEGFRGVKVKYVPLSAVTERMEHAHQNSAIMETPKEDVEVRDRALALLTEIGGYNSSDIRIRRLSRHTEIACRINGRYMVAHEWENAFADRLMRAMYRLGSSQAASVTDSQFQDGGISGDILKGTGLDNVRIVRGPCVPLAEGGWFMILRLQSIKRGVNRRVRGNYSTLHPLQGPPGHLRLKDYGFSQRQIDRLMGIAMSPSGAIIFTAPTGHGKTTTLYEIWAEKARIQPGRNIVTIEQPVELSMPWAIQLDIPNTDNEDENGRALRERQRATLRMDPDDIGLGEMRDVDGAITCFTAVQTGHFVASTCHVDDPFDLPFRLQIMDFTRLNFATTCNASLIRGIVSQRLVPVICPHCAVPWTKDDKRLATVINESVPTWCPDPALIRRIGPGCEHCYGTGIAGRTCVAEVIETDEELMSDFVTHGVNVARHRYRSRPDADPSLLETAMKLVAEGKLDPFDVNTTVDRIRPREKVLKERRDGASRGAQ